MGHINQKAYVDVPSDWSNMFTEAQKNVNVVEMKGENFFDSENYIRPLYKSTCPMKTRPMREIMFVSQHPQLISTEIRG